MYIHRGIQFHQTFSIPIIIVDKKKKKLIVTVMILIMVITMMIPKLKLMLFDADIYDNKKIIIMKG